MIEILLVLLFIIVIFSCILGVYLIFYKLLKKIYIYYPGIVAFLLIIYFWLIFNVIISDMKYPEYGFIIRQFKNITEEVVNE